MSAPLRRHAARVLALAIVALLYGFARPALLAPAERDALAARFAFTALTLPELPGPAPRTVRTVHPSLTHIDAWISAVGASVALADLDGDGLANDLCLVDPRTDRVLLMPVPGTGERFAPRVLAPDPLPYDAATTAPMGCLAGDLDEDGHTDLLVYYWGRTPIAFLAAGDGYRAVEIVTPIARWYTNAATRADLDGDGHPDLVFGNYFADGARILDAHANGRRERMQHSMSRAYNGGRTHFLLWQAADAGDAPGMRYVPAAVELPHDVLHGWTLALGAADLDGDALPELYLAHDFGPDRLLHNRSRPGRLHFAVLRGERGFTTPASKVLGHDSFKGMGIDFGDINGDGLLDLYVSNIAADYALHESHFMFLSTGEVARMPAGHAPYVDRSEALGLARSDWGWESRLADFDNDGVLEAIQATGFVRGEVDRWPELQELAIANDELPMHPPAWPRFRPGDDLSGHAHNPFFVRAADGRYHDLAHAVGLGANQVSRGIATADVDGDGDLDVMVANQWQPSMFYRNDCPRCGRFLGLHLHHPARGAPGGDGIAVRAGHPAGAATTPAIGASARVIHPDGRVLAAQVDGGNGHSGQRSPTLHFGLGDLPRGQRVTVELRWRARGGAPRRHTLELPPGWHTVVLGGAAAGHTALNAPEPPAQRSLDHVTAAHRALDVHTAAGAPTVPTRGSEPRRHPKDTPR